MPTQVLETIRQSLPALFPDEITDLKRDFEREFNHKTSLADALHQVIRKERQVDEYCRHCGSKHIVKNGKTPKLRQKYRCVDCGKSYSDTQDSIVAFTKKPYHVWETFIRCMMQGISLRETAVWSGISTTTAFHWRHKIMETLKRYDQSRTLRERVQIDETYFLINLKGTRPLTRKAKKRQVSAQKRGISNEHVCVLTAVDAQDNIFIEIVDQGNPTAHNIIKSLNNRIQPNTTMITDSRPAYKVVAKHFDLTLEQVPSGFHTKGIFNLGEVNELHSSMKNWFTQFKGVSTKHLSRYLAWFRFTKLLHYQKPLEQHHRTTMNHALREQLTFLVESICKTPFPVDINKAFS